MLRRASRRFVSHSIKRSYCRDTPQATQIHIARSSGPSARTTSKMAADRPFLAARSSVTGFTDVPPTSTYHIAGGELEVTLAAGNGCFPRVREQHSRKRTDVTRAVSVINSCLDGTDSALWKPIQIRGMMSGRELPWFGLLGPLVPSPLRRHSTRCTDESPRINSFTHLPRESPLSKCRLGARIDLQVQPTWKISIKGTLYAYASPCPPGHRGGPYGQHWDWRSPFLAAVITDLFNTGVTGQ